MGKDEVAQADQSHVQIGDPVQTSKPQVGWDSQLYPFSLRPTFFQDLGKASPQSSWDCIRFGCGWTSLQDSWLREGVSWEEAHIPTQRRSLSVTCDMP